MGPPVDRDLLSDLSDRSWRVRARAQRLLKGSASLTGLRRAALAASDAEVKERLWQCYRAAKRKQMAAWRPWPMVDAWWYDRDRNRYGCRPEWGQRYLAQARGKHYPNQSRCWTLYRQATRLWVSDRLDAGVPAWWVERELIWMHTVDARWVTHHFGCYHPDVPFTQMKVPYGMQALR